MASLRKSLLLALFAWPMLAHALSPAEVLRQANQQIHRFTMENGIIGLVKPDPTAPVVAIQLWFGTGSIHEDEFLGAGLSHYVEHMIFKGTPTRSTGEISRQLDAAGGRVNAYTTLDRTVFHVVLPAANWEVGLEVLADAVMNAAFPEEEWEKEQVVILQEMAMGRDDPHRELSKLLWNTAFRVHPYRHPVIGYEEVFRQTTRADLLNFFYRHYTPDNLIVALAGNVDPVQVEQRVREILSPFQRRMNAPVYVPQEPPQMAPRTARKTGDYEVSRAAWAYHTVALHHPDAAALDLLAHIVGGSESARLTLALRDRLQRVHDISAWSYTPGQPGLFGISATFDADQEAAVIDALAAEIETWRHSGFTEAEIQRAQRQVMVRLLTELESVRGQVNSIATGEFYAGDPRLTERYLAAVESITAADLTRVLNQYLRPDLQTLALLTPEPAISVIDTVSAELDLLRPVRRTLANGIPVIIREDPRLPLTHVSLALLGGLLSETESQQGITQFMTDLLTRGTSTRSGQDIAEHLDRLGASLTAFAGQNSFGLQGMSLADDTADLLAIMAECLLDSQFPETEITRQRARQLAQIRALRESPIQLADDAVRQALHPQHPYRWTPLGSEESVSQLQQNDLHRHLRNHAHAGNLAISIFGPLSADEAVAMADAAFAAVPAGHAPTLSHEQGDRDLPREIIQSEPRQQTIYLMAFPGLDVRDSELTALEILQTALSGLSSALGMEIREKRGLVYFVGAFQRAGLDPGRFVLYAGTYPEAVPEMQQLMEAEIARLKQEGLTEEERARAQEQMVGSFYALLQDNGTLAQMSALNELYGLGYDHLFGREAHIRAVTGADIQRLARRIFDFEQRVISIVYPAHTKELARDE